MTIFYSACNNTVIELFWRDESRPRISKKFIFHRIGRWTRFRAIFFFFQFFAIHGWDTGMTNDNSLSRAINMIYRVKLKFRFESRLIWILRVFFFRSFLKVTTSRFKTLTLSFAGNIRRDFVSISIALSWISISCKHSTMRRIVISEASSLLFPCHGPLP